MRAIKSALDPAGLLNPGVLFAADDDCAVSRRQPPVSAS